MITNETCVTCKKNKYYQRYVGLIEELYESENDLHTKAVLKYLLDYDNLTKKEWQYDLSCSRI